MLSANRAGAVALWASFLLAGAVASAQITLDSVASPSEAPPLLTTVSVAGIGFPSGTICPTCVSVTITPPAGNGSSVVTTSIGVTPITGGSNRVIQFRIPVSLTAAQALPNSQVSISGETSAAVSFSSTNFSVLQIDPPAGILSASPGAATRGNTVTLNIVGSYTHFTTTTPSVILTGPGGSPVLTPVSGSVIVTDSTHLSAQFVVPADATSGTYLVQTVVGTETASLANGFLVSVNPGLTISSLVPNSGAAGSCASLAVVGSGTSWQNGVTVATFGDGIKVNGAGTGLLTVTDATHATIPICIDPIAVLGSRGLTISTGGEYEMASNAFTITSNGATLQSVAPITGPQGTNATLTLTGVGTHWLQGATTVSLGGINVGNIVVNSPTSLTVNISIPAAAAVSSYPVTVATHGEIVSLPNAFSVTLATPYLSTVSPSSGSPGQTLSVTFTGVLTTFLTGNFTANFGSDITVNGPIVPASDTSATANITISSTAFTGGRTGFISTNGTIYHFSFTVNGAASAFITSVTPSSGYQGASVALAVTGSGTHWADGLTFASLGGSIIVNRVVVNSATSAEVDITIPSSAGTGSYSLTMSTNGEIETLPGAFTVLPYTPSLTLAPSSGMIGTTVSVNLTGNFTHFGGSASAYPTVADIDGEGVTILNFDVTGPHSATAQFVIDSTAPTAPSVPCVNAYGGNRIVTLTTPLGVSAEIVQAGFCVTSTPAVLTSISPFASGEPTTNLQVSITGQYTHFVQGTTTVGFGPEIVVVPGSVTVADATHLTAWINIPANTPIGWLPVFVNTGTEQLTIGFSIVPPASASLVSVAPGSGIQGQSLTVNITGNLTNFDQATSQAILGSGITVNNLTVNSPASATAQISISPTTYAGGRTVSMISGVNESEVVSGPLFSVTPGVASISLVGCGGNNDANGSVALTNLAASPCNISSNGIPQGAITSFAVQGSGTHWVQGETTLDFGSGITVATLTVKSPTQAVCQITVSYSAALGFRQVTATTNGEVAPSFSDAVNIVASSGLDLNITPLSSAQGTTFTMQVNGTATHFTAGNTTASFGNNNGVNITAVNVISQTQMNLTVQVLGTAYAPGPYTLTVTTTGLPVPPNVQSTEQLILPNVFSVTSGAGIITNVTPSGGKQGTTAALQVTGQNTSFQTGVTTAFLSTAGCSPAYSAGVNVSNVTASSNTSATVSIAISPTAPTGYQTLCMYTLGEAVSYGNAFTVTPGTPTLNSVTTPTSGSTGQQGEVISNITLTGQYTNWTQGITTATFGQGITLADPIIVTSPTTATADIVIDPLAYTGSRLVTVTTGSEIVKGTFFNVTTGPAILSAISPSSANQGQHILMTITGQFTHWSQTLTQFSISGGGYDITVNGVVINSPTQALADLTITGNAGLGTRTVFMSTVGENVALNAGFLVTGGVPSISSVSPGSGTVGDVGDNIIITGAFTHWDSTTVVDFGDPAITVTNLSNNSSTSETAVITIGAGANLGLHTVTVRTGGQALLSQFNVLSKALPPTPYISYIYPGVALVGQTLQVNLYGSYTKWNPSTTTATFGAGIIVNTFQITGLNSATANITIIGSPGVPVGEAGPGSATPGYRSVILTTGAEQETTSFYVTVGTPVISLVDPVSAIQGDTRDVDLVGQYTTWDNATTKFTFCSGIVVNSTTVFGPNAARVNVTVPILQPVGGCGVVATTGTEVAYNISSFSITPSTATITDVTPNTAIQGTQNFSVNVTGLATHWDSSTNFSFGSGSVGVASITVIDNTHATLTLDLAPLATPGFYSLTATTGGESATLHNAFVVQPGTPILLSSTPGSFQQQGQFSIGILGQYTSFVNGTTTVTLSGLGANITTVNVTGPQSITVLGTVSALAYPGCSNIIVTTGAQVLTLYSAFCITPGPAAITLLTPNNGLTGTTFDVQITGTNTNFAQGTTVGTFGPGISLNTLTVSSNTSATANITVAANAVPQANTVTLTTAGEQASDPSSFTILQSTPILDIVTPSTLSQGTTNTNITIDSSFTNFVNGNTTADFGAGVTVNGTTVTSATTATANISVTPIAATGTRTVRMITNLGGGAQEIAIKSNSFTVTAGTASISSITPTTPVTVHQGDSGDILSVTGSGTHFTQATLTNASVVFCSGISTAAVQVIDDLHLNATVNVGAFAPVGACAVTVTTGGEVATGGSFNILGGLPVITQISPNAAQQGQTLSINITGQYTHFTSGALTVAIPGGTLNGAVTASNNTSATASFTFSNTATLGLEDVQVSDTTDGTLSDHSAFTVNAGVPALLSVLPNSQGQGVTQTVTLTGVFTHFGTNSVVTLSGTGVTVGSVVTATASATSIQVPITVPAATPAGTRGITVQTPVSGGTETVSLNSAYTILPGVPNITGISPNIGVPNSSVSVTITGIFTNWVQGTTMASFGPGISVNGSASGTPGTVTVNSATSATANLTIDAGATIGAQDVVVTTGAQVLTATGGFQILSSTTTPPAVTYISPTNGASGVPINTNVTVVFSEPLDPTTVPSSGANAFITDSAVSSCWAASGLPATVSLDVSGRVLTITPASSLAIGRTFYLQLNSYYIPGGTPSIADQSGNVLGHGCYSFTTGFTASSSGPTFLSANLPAGATGVPTNTQRITLGFDQPINPATQAAGLSMTTGASVAVPGTWSYNTDFTQAIFTPASAWTASTTYSVTYGAQLQNMSAQAITNPGNFSFTTSTGADTISGAYVTWTPPTGGSTPTTGTNPTIRFIYNKPINPLTVTPSGFYVYDTQNGATVLGSTISHSADFKTFTLTLAAPLLPGTNYRWVMYSATDWVGNGVPYGSVTFTTGAVPDTTAPDVSSISPSPVVTCGASPCAPVNSEVTIQFSELMDPTSLTAGAVTLTPTAPAGPAVSGTFSFSPDSSCTTPSSSSACNFSLLTFTPSANLAPSTTYQISIPDGGLADLSGNFDPFTSSFTTGSSSTPDTTHGTITSITPTSGATNVAVNTNVVVQLNKAVDPLTVNAGNFRVYDSTASLNVPGTITTSPNLQTLTFTQSQPFPANHQICVYASYFSNFYDLAGNAFNSSALCFTAGAGTDTVAPTVLSVSPLNNATGIGPNNPVMVTFSKSINPGTLGNHVAIFNGSTLFTSGYTLSGDGTTITFSTGNLPFSTTFTVVINPSITDLAGNNMAAQFSSTFTTAPQPVTAQPSVTAMRPGNGATGVEATAPITFFMSAPMNPATINSNTLIISQNGVALTGAIAVAASNQDVTFTPTGGTFTGGALIQIFFTSGATDASGNPLYNYQSQFTVAPSLTGVAPAIVSFGPCRYCTANDANTAFEILFNKPIDPATAISSNFFVSTGFSPTPLVAGTITQLDGGRLLRFKPSSPLAPNTYYTVYATTDIKDTTGLNFTGGSTSYLSYVSSGTGSNSAAPAVSATAPTNGATGIGTNAVISVTFTENVDQNTLDPSIVTLTGPGGNIPLSIGYNPSTFVMTVTPQAPMPPNSSITLTLNGVTDADGDALNPTPYSNLTFTTGTSPDYSAPVFVTSNITNNQANVPVTTSVSFIFNKPLDFRSVIYTNTVFLQDATAGYPNVPATVTPIGSNGLLITPTSQLSVNHQYRAYTSGLADLNGNVSGFIQFYFYTVLAAPTGGPVVTQMVPLNGTTPPVNFRPMVQFDRPVSPLSLAGVTLMAGSNPVAATPQLSSGGTILTLVPNAILSPSTAYTFTVAGVQDSAGNAQSGSVSSSFTTGPSFELTNPVVTVASPIYNSTTGTNPDIQLTFSEPVNPITSGSFNFYNVSVGGYVNGSTLVWAADYKSVRIVYPGALSPGSRYYFYLNSVCNLAGNCTGSPSTYFYTGSSADTTPETVTGVNPPNGATGVPLNPAITLLLAKPAAPGSVNNSSVTLSPAPASGTDTVNVSSDGYTLTLSLGSNLQASTGYTINVAAGAFTDQDGNAASAFSSSFTTGTSTEVSGFHSTISMTAPAPGASGVAITSSITATFGQPLNPNSLSADSFVVFENNNGNNRIAGTVTNPTPNTLVFTPAVALPANQTINVYVGYYASITDYAGNTFNSLSGGSNAVFTTANTVDNTPPQVISMSPGAGTTNVGPYAGVSLTFNKSLDYNTINSTNFAMYYGPTNANPSVSYSSDRRTVYLNTTLPYNTTVQVAVNTGVQDYAGNNMANAYQATFTTQQQPTTSSPSVIQARPGSGTDVTSPITLFMSAPMNLSSVQNGVGMFVAQNGVLISGATTLTADQRGIIWTPAANFLPGALIEAYLTSNATDTSGNQATAYKLSFTTAAVSTGAPTEISSSPSRYTSVTFTNPMVEVQFSEPINPATVTSTTFTVSQGSGPGGTVIAGTLSFLNGNTIVRFTPSAPFPSNAYFYVSLSTGIQDVSGNAFAGDGYWVYVNATAVDNTPPTVTGVTPVDSATSIGDNAPIRLLFSKAMDTESINAGTVQILNGATPLPWTVTFSTLSNSSQTVARLLPQSPLPDSTAITVHLTAGITDLTGAAISAQSTTFNTMAGADFNGPVVVQQSINDNNNTNVPTNATFTFVFNKPLDPSSVIANTTGSNTSGFYIYNSNGSPNYPAINANVSPDGRTVSIIPQSSLSPSATNDYVYVYNATDLNGNPQTGTQQRFLTAATTNVTGPTIVATNPLSTDTSPVPTNTSIEVVFSAPVSGTSFGSITLTGGANAPYSVVFDNSKYTDDTVIRIVPQSLLLPDTTYTVHVTGVTDVAGNAAGTTTFTFTTGPNFQTTGANFASATVTTGGGTVALPVSPTVVSNVLDTPTITVTFDHAIDYATLLHNGITLRDTSNNLVTGVTLNYALSADQKTVSITTSGLAAATTYHLIIGYFNNLYDISGNGLQNYAFLYFTTQ